MKVSGDLRRWSLGFMLMWVLAAVLGAAPGRSSSRDHPIWRDPNHETPHRTRYHAFHSDTVGGPVSCLVWLPPAYVREPRQRFSVIYWLHGAGGSQRTFAETFLPAYVEALKKRAAPPAIVVGVNGIPGSFYGDAIDGSCPIEKVIIQDLIPAIDRDFRSIPAREGRMIEGFSMGGFGAARLGFKYPDVFGAVAIHSAGPLSTGDSVPKVLQPIFGNHAAELPHRLAEANQAALRGKTLIRILCGSRDRLLEGNRSLHETLTRLNIPHHFREVPGVEHSGRELYRRVGPRAFQFHQRAFGNREGKGGDN